MSDSLRHVPDIQRLNLLAPDQSLKPVGFGQQSGDVAFLVLPFSFGTLELDHTAGSNQAPVAVSGLVSVSQSFPKLQ